MASQPQSLPLPIEGGLAYGIRHLASDPSALQQFRIDFEDYIDRNTRHLHAALAFAEPNGEPTRLHIVLWYKNYEPDETEASSEPLSTLLSSLSSKAFGPLRDEECADDSSEDGVFHTYNSHRCDGLRRENTEGRPSAPRTAAQEEHGCTLLEGYLRPPPAETETARAAAAAATSSLPMIGIFRRAVRTGFRSELGKSFRAVCDIWYRTVPGILGAMVFADPHHEDLVHDVRIFANKTSYDAHVDKSNQELVRAMEDWFSNYDTSVPHKGIMVAEDTSDPSTRTSSIKDRPVRVDFFVFHYGQSNCMGKVLGSEVTSS